MKEIEFRDFLEKKGTIKADRVEDHISVAKNVLKDLTGKDDPFSSIDSLDDLYAILDDVKNTDADKLTRRVSQGSGAGRAVLKNLSTCLKNMNPSDPKNSSGVETKIDSILKEHDKRPDYSVGKGSIGKKGAMSSGSIYPKDITSDSEIGLEKEILSLIKTAYNIILHGAPGTGKTHLALSIAKSMGCTKDTVKMVQFHPSYDYTDFVEGLRPFKDEKTLSIGFVRKDGAFKDFCKKAVKAKREADKEQRQCPAYVFIIDEINRGEISKILGECMFSIDPGYVGRTDIGIETQYQNLIDDPDDPFRYGFYRPENVYIIGTMNDIDRGVESMDLAMRRRFQFNEIRAEDTQSEILDKLTDPSLRTTAKRKMNALNKEIRDTPELGEDYCIGASYFLKVENFSKDKWNNLWDKHLKGLLKEYVRGLEDTTLMEKFKTAYDD